MLSDNARAKSQRIVGSLLLSSAVAMLAACGGAPNPGDQTSSTPNNNSSSTNSQPNNSSSTTTSSTGTTSSSGNNSSTAGSSSSSPIFTTNTPGIFRVNPQGRITKNDQVMPVRCANWFGLEGQHEEDGGAPLELYIGNMWWTDSTRTIDDAIQDMQTMGINMIRLPIAPETLIANHPDGVGWRDPDAGGNDSNPLKNKKNVYDYPDARSAMIDVISKLGDANIAVMVDIHSCSSYVGWRAGSFDAAPPYADKDRGPDYLFTREDYSCAAGGATNVVPEGNGSAGYNEAKWLADIRDIATIAKTHTNIIGIDIFNEPWEYSWDEWATLSEKAYEVIEETNDNLLIFVQGVATEKDTPHGDESTNPNWGENFYGFNERPLNIPQNRLVISPHTYGPAVYQQMQFMDLDKDPTCEGLHGEEAAEHKCDMKLEASRLRPGWEEHFGFLRDMGYATVIGEFGGNRFWPVGGGARQSETDAWGHLTGAVTGENNIDWQWQKLFFDYMKDEEIEGCYWGFNPESSDTGGLYIHGYDTDEGAWGTWESFDDVKINQLKDLWGI